MEHWIRVAQKVSHVLGLAAAWVLLVAGVVLLLCDDFEKGVAFFVAGLVTENNVRIGRLYRRIMESTDG